MIVRRAVKNSTVVPRGGAIDMEISKYLRQHSRTIAWKSQLFINSYAKALEILTWIRQASLLSRRSLKNFLFGCKR
ncbi:T-complex protein 1 subunit eta [Arabidopsis lyrata subsp. lyrata]|uniref:T-complex protein 1 subunit eta n=1 Tax=Arabidopsis lyrata subsp. lyrata TaxID=81972 RepID=UPI000A29DAE6|nr:T-complex protein 1 subunit eta [Arabidopsis lyrata subsp. lyrata]|eukprot:XP_020871806.1 T-complex protein 1 subunit eta [Arabidopsis lyrata subsp. lyrata]